MSISYAGSFGWAGGGKSGATVDLWLQSRFAEPPGENTSAPAGNPDAGPVTTGPEFGSPGAFLISDITEAADYYVRVLYAGITYWGAVPAGNLSGTGGGGGGSINRVTSPNNTLVVTNPTGPTVNLDIANSVNLPGAPTAATASPGTNTTQIATTAFVIANSGTIAPSLANEQFVRNQPLNMMTAPTGGISMNYQVVSNVGAQFWTDGTVADGLIYAQLNPGLISFWTNETDFTGSNSSGTAGSPVLELGTISSAGAISFGAGGTAASTDATLSRLTTGQLQLTGSGGAVRLDSAGGVSTWHASGDANAIMAMGSVGSAPIFSMGPGGSTPFDISLPRTGASSSTWTSSTMIWGDGTAGHGSFKLATSSLGTGISIQNTAGDSQGAVNIACVSGIASMGLGPGGSTNTDVGLSRTTTATGQWTYSKMLWTDGTAGHGQIQHATTSAGSQVAIFLNTADTQPIINMSNALSQPSIGMGPGGSTSTDLAFTRTGTSAGSALGLWNYITGLEVLNAQTTTYTSTPSTFPLALNTGSTFTFGSAFSGNVNIGQQFDISGTFVYQAAGFAFGSLSGINFHPTVKNDSGFTVGFGAITGIASAPTFTADTKTGIGAGTYVGYSSTATYGVANAGTFTSATYTAYSAGLTVGTGTTVSTGTMFSIGAPTVTGTLTTWIGLDVAAVTGAGTNIGIRNASALLQQGAIVLTPTTVTVTSNAGTVPVTASNAKFTNSSAATMTITIATSGASDGQELVVRVYDFSAAAETITWVNTENGGASVPTTSNGSTTLPKTVTFMFNSATTKWRCIASA